jgi:hypothetical protein
LEYKFPIWSYGLGLLSKVGISNEFSSFANRKWRSSLLSTAQSLHTGVECVNQMEITIWNSWRRLCRFVRISICCSVMTQENCGLCSVCLVIL